MYPFGVRHVKCYPKMSVRTGQIYGLDLRTKLKAWFAKIQPKPVFLFQLRLIALSAEYYKSNSDFAAVGFRMTCIIWPEPGRFGPELRCGPAYAAVCPVLRHLMATLAGVDISADVNVAFDRPVKAHLASRPSHQQAVTSAAVPWTYADGQALHCLTYKTSHPASVHPTQHCSIQKCLL